MKLVALLLAHSRSTIALAILAAIASGALNTALLVLLNSAYSHAGEVQTGLSWAFFSLCLLVFLMRTGSEFLLIRLGQETVLKLRLELSRRILAVALRRLEEIGPHRILSTLTADIPLITSSCCPSCASTAPSSSPASST